MGEIKVKKIDIKKIFLFKNVFKIIAIIIVIVAIIFFISLKKGKETIISSATLTDMVDISELSTAQFTYNGIAEVYENKEKNKVKCYIKYNSIVKANINMEEINFEINRNNKTVKPILPEIKLTPKIITGENSLSFIPEDTKLELKEVLLVCEEDAKNEALNSPGLLKYAEENLKDTLEALLLPVIESSGYQIIWE